MGNAMLQVCLRAGRPGDELVSMTVSELLPIAFAIGRFPLPLCVLTGLLQVATRCVLVVPPNQFSCISFVAMSCC
jgi:hypothetical protein